MNVPCLNIVLEDQILNKCPSMVSFDFLHVFWPPSHRAKVVSRDYNGGLLNMEDANETQIKTIT